MMTPAACDFDGTAACTLDGQVFSIAGGRGRLAAVWTAGGKYHVTVSAVTRDGRLRVGFRAQRAYGEFLGDTSYHDDFTEAVIAHGFFADAIEFASDAIRGAL